MPTTTKVVNSNPIHDQVYSIQYCVIKFVSDLRQVGCFLWVFHLKAFFSTNKTLRYNWNIVESGVKHHKPNQSRMESLETQCGHKEREWTQVLATDK